eukprot:408681_1
MRSFSLFVVVFLCCISFINGNVRIHHNDQSVLLETSDAVDLNYLSDLFGVPSSDIIGFRKVNDELIIRASKRNLDKLIDGDALTMILKPNYGSVSSTSGQTNITAFTCYECPDPITNINSYDDWRQQNPMFNIINIWSDAYSPFNNGIIRVLYVAFTIPQN